MHITKNNKLFITIAHKKCFNLKFQLLISNFVTLSLTPPSGPIQVDLTNSPQSSTKIKFITKIMKTGGVLSENNPKRYQNCDSNRIHLSSF